jgi:dihydrofolate synthase / folylpolyglutamate synthase
MDPVRRLFDLERFGIKLGLETIRLLCAALGRPERAWPSTHIAGTNGKGSVAVMIDAALRAAGRSTGRYTSPHLDRLEERFAVDGVPVATGAMIEAIEDVFAAVDRLTHERRLTVPPTFFEVTTAVAFLLFARARVDAAVIEVGLGGRYDATNILEPRVTVITSIDLDHERHLGSTLPEIASEKAGIAKRGIPLVVGPCAPEAARAIAEAAAAAGAPLVPATEGVRCEASFERGRATVSVTTPVRAYPPMTLGLAGRHQVGNAIVAIRAIECVEQATGMSIGGEAVAAGLAGATWPARLEWIDLPAGRRVLLDAAHNPAGAASLAQYLDDAGVAPLPIVVAVMKDKDTAGILAPLAARARPLVVTEAATARTLPAATLAAAAARVGAPAVVIEPDAARALAHAFSCADRVAVAGSLFLVGPLGARLRAGGGGSS